MVRVTEASLALHQVPGRPHHRRAAERSPMPDRPPRRRLAPRPGPKPCLKPCLKPGRTVATEPGGIDPVPGVGPGNANGPRPGRCPGGNPAPLPTLREPAAAATRPSAPPRSNGLGQLQPMRVPPRSRRARQEASAGPATRAGCDRRPAVRKIGLPVVRKDLRPLMEPIVRRFPIARTKRAAARHAAGKGAVDLLGRVAGPAEVHRALGQPDSTLPDLTPLGPPVRNGHSREPRDPGRPPRGALAVMPMQKQMPGEPKTTGRVLPAMPGRGQSLAPAEAEKVAAIAARGRPLSPGLNPGHGPAGLQQIQGKQNEG